MKIEIEVELEDGRKYILFPPYTIFTHHPENKCIVVTKEMEALKGFLGINCFNPEWITIYTPNETGNITMNIKSIIGWCEA